MNVNLFAFGFFFMLDNRYERERCIGFPSMPFRFCSTFLNVRNSKFRITIVACRCISKNLTGAKFKRSIIELRGTSIVFVLNMDT